MVALYGPESSQQKAFQRSIEGLRDKDDSRNIHMIRSVIGIMRGVLGSIKAELDSGFIGSLSAMLTGEVLTDFIKLARATLEEPGDDARNVAAVLAAAAFEDVLRKIADLKGSISHREKLADTLVALKDLAILQGSEIGIAQSYLNFRNRALHAQWDKVDRPAIESILGFIEQMILKHLA